MAPVPVSGRVKWGEQVAVGFSPAWAGARASSGAGGKTVKPRGFLVRDSLEQGLFFT